MRLLFNFDFVKPLRRSSQLQIEKPLAYLFRFPVSPMPLEPNEGSSRVIGTLAYQPRLSDGPTPHKPRATVERGVYSLAEHTYAMAV